MLFFPNSPVPDYVKSTVETVMKIHQTEGDGDILAFLTGQVDTKETFYPVEIVTLM